MLIKMFDLRFISINDLRHKSLDLEYEIWYFNDTKLPVIYYFIDRYIIYVFELGRSFCVGHKLFYLYIGNTRTLVIIFRIR